MGNWLVVTTQPHTGHRSMIWIAVSTLRSQEDDLRLLGTPRDPGVAISVTELSLVLEGVRPLVAIVLRVHRLSIRVVGPTRALAPAGVRLRAIRVGLRRRQELRRLEPVLEARLEALTARVGAGRAIVARADVGLTGVLQGLLGAVGLPQAMAPSGRGGWLVGAAVQVHVAAGVVRLKVRNGDFSTGRTACEDHVHI